MLTATKKNVSVKHETYIINNGAKNDHTFKKGICYEMTGKMDGMISFSTSVLMNQYCQERRKNEKLICSECFAAAMGKVYGENFNNKLAKNTELVTSRVLDFDELPIINYVVFRLEAFGDVQNVTQVINYFNLCNKNPKCRFTIWTKNPWLFKDAIEAGHEKPENLNIVLSSPCLNHCVKTRFDFIDTIFTVYTAEYALTHNIKINCGSRKCLECMNCYSMVHISNVNEILKKESNFYYKTLNLLDLYINSYGNCCDEKTVKEFLRGYRKVKGMIPSKLTIKRFAAIVSGYCENMETV